jgi:hypothetical protein
MTIQISVRVLFVFFVVHAKKLLLLQFEITLLESKKFDQSLWSFFGKVSPRYIHR